MKNSKRTLILLLVSIGSVVALTGFSKQLIKHPVPLNSHTAAPTSSDPSLVYYDAFQYFKSGKKYLNDRTDADGLDQTFVLPILKILHTEHHAKVSIALFKNDTTRVYSIFITGVKDTDSFVKSLGSAVAGYDGDVLWRRDSQNRIQLDFLTSDEAKELYR